MVRKREPKLILSVQLLFAVALCGVMALLSGCEDTPYDPALYYIEPGDPSSGNYSLIRHPYIFENLGLKIDELRVKREGDSIYLLGNLQGNIEGYTSCMFYFHAYKHTGDTFFTKMSSPLETSGEVLKFQRKLKLEPGTRFEEVRFGLACDGTRPLSLSLEEVVFE